VKLMREWFIVLFKCAFFISLLLFVMARGAYASAVCNRFTYTEPLRMLGYQRAIVLHQGANHVNLTFPLIQGSHQGLLTLVYNAPPAYQPLGVAVYASGYLITNVTARTGQNQMQILIPQRAFFGPQLDVQIVLSLAHSNVFIDPVQHEEIMPSSSEFARAEFFLEPLSNLTVKAGHCLIPTVMPTEGEVSA